ncbi:MAG: tRNA-uridine aminocarboxypropyltransferase [Bacteriovoracia bacterium]
MNLAQYKEQKELRYKKAKETLSELRNPCPKCRKAQNTCYCSLIEPIKTSAQFVILIHPKENKNTIGTGRLTHLSITNSHLIEGVDYSHDQRVNQILANTKNECVVLYPSADAIDISQSIKPLDDLRQKGKNLVIFVLDGTWYYAKKMLKVSKNLKKLPRVCFNPPNPSIYKIRRQPGRICFSTVEAVSFISSKMGDPGHERLIKVFESMIDQQLSYCGVNQRQRAARGVRVKVAES